MEGQWTYAQGVSDPTRVGKSVKLVYIDGYGVISDPTRVGKSAVPTALPTAYPFQTPRVWGRVEQGVLG